MARYYYRCRSCGEDFTSPVRETCCAECLSADIVGGNLVEEEDAD